MRGGASTSLSSGILATSRSTNYFRMSTPEQEEFARKKSTRTSRGSSTTPLFFLAPATNTKNDPLPPFRARSSFKFFDISTPAFQLFQNDAVSSILVRIGVVKGRVLSVENSNS